MKLNSFYLFCFKQRKVLLNGISENVNIKFLKFELQSELEVLFFFFLTKTSTDTLTELSETKLQSRKKVKNQPEERSILPEMPMLLPS